MIKHLFGKFKEAVFAVIPVAVIVLVLCLTVAKVSFEFAPAVLRFFTTPSVPISAKRGQFREGLVIV